MSAFLKALFALVIVAGAAEFLLSDETLRGFVRFACGLILILMLLDPLRQVLSGNFAWQSATGPPPAIQDVTKEER